MADVEVVIKIPKELYYYIKNQVAEGIINPLKVYIAKGVQLPKDHGRIIDVDKMEYLKAIHDAKYGKISWSEAIRQIKNSAPTIIKADKE